MSNACVRSSGARATTSRPSEVWAIASRTPRERRRREEALGALVVRGRIRLRLLLANWAAIAAAVCICGLAIDPRSIGRFAAGAVVVGAIGGIALSALAVRWFDETVRPVTDAARRMRGGDLSVRAR